MEEAMDVTISTAPMVTLLVVTPGNVCGTERRFPKDLTLRDLKDKLVLITGASSESMRLQLKSKDGRTLLGALDGDDRLLGSFPVENGLLLDVTDPSVRLEDYNDVSKVEKFEMSKDAYEKRDDSVASFKKRNKLGRFQEVDTESVLAKEAEASVKAAQEEELAKDMSVGSRCEVTIPKAPARRGTIAFNGTVHFKPGTWIGIKYDEPVGKNDGTVDGHRYFQCPPKYGGFTKPQNIVIGDFPEDEFSDDEM